VECKEGEELCNVCKRQARSIPLDDRFRDSSIEECSQALPILQKGPTLQEDLALDNIFRNSSISKSISKQSS
jgi:hypothetical protein